MLIEVRDASHAGEARRQAVACAEEVGLSESERGAVAVVVTEMATNLFKHARDGSIIISQIANNGSRGIRVLALDKGPGIRNLSEALQDGHSTSGTMGTGLGAIKRMSHEFEIYSVESGTAVVSDFWCGGKVPKNDWAVRHGVVTLPFPGEREIGDGWTVRKFGGCIILMVVDGLGHGPNAAEAAREAERIVSVIKDCTPTAILQDCHDALKKTRGAAMSVAVLDPEKQLLHYAGIGNVAAAIVSPETSRSLTPYNGTLGHQIHRIREFSYPWNPDSILVMHSDGLNTRWDLGSYPGIWNKQPALIAGLLYRDSVRGRDDVTVLVAKNQA
jgi:anti-sigma regulatory factor (Ser/Thr protein kinase)